MDKKDLKHQLENSLSSSSKDQLRKLLKKGLVWQASSNLVPPKSEAEFNKYRFNKYSSDESGLDESSPDERVLTSAFRKDALHEVYCNFSHAADSANLEIESANTILSWLAANSLENLEYELPNSERINSKSNHLESETLTKLKSFKLIIWIGKECWPSVFLLKENFLLKEDLQKETLLREVTEKGSVDSNGKLEPNLFTQSIFIDPPSEELRLWSIETALRSAATSAVIAYCPRLSFVLSQRFSLASQQGATFGVLVRPYNQVDSPSAAYSKWLISPEPPSSDSLEEQFLEDHPRWRLNLLKKKGAHSRRSEWILQGSYRWSGCKFYSNQPGNYVSENKQTLSMHIPPELARNAGPILPQKAVPEKEAPAYAG